MGANSRGSTGRAGGIQSNPTRLKTRSPNPRKTGYGLEFSNPEALGLGFGAGFPNCGLGAVMSGSGPSAHRGHMIGLSKLWSLFGFPKYRDYRDYIGVLWG